ncbi:MAG: isoprenylcysteine carboxylmethyltransferase family protein [Syntrophaceae bacterium]|nr:isoprenylcysteine carboxylmethyltransferase family protein [Syntrophaceae bacterium]
MKTEKPEIKTYEVHFISRLLLPPKGIEHLARWVPELRKPAGQILLPIIWLFCILSATALFVYFDRKGFVYSFFSQTVAVLTCAVLVDVLGTWRSRFWRERLGKNGYRFCFWFLFTPGLFFCFIPASFHPAYVPGDFIAGHEYMFAVGIFFAAIGVLTALRIYAVFGLDRFLYLYIFFPEEGSMADDEIFNYIRHPQYASFLYLGIGFSLMNGTWQSVVLSLPNLLFAFFRIIPEERDLVNRFGESYSDYRKRVPALIPRYGEIMRFLNLLIFKIKELFGSSSDK